MMQLLDYHDEAATSDEGLGSALPLPIGLPGVPLPLTQLFNLFPPQQVAQSLLWSNEAKINAVKDFANWVADYNRAEKVWGQIAGAIEAGYDPFTTADQIKQWQDFNRVFTQNGAILGRMYGQLRDAAAQAARDGRITPQQHQASGLAALPIIALALIAAAVFAYLGSSWYSDYSTAKPQMAYMNSLTTTMDNYYKYWERNVLPLMGQPNAPTAPLPAGVNPATLPAFGTTTTATSGIASFGKSAVIIAAIVAGLMLLKSFRPGGARSAAA